MNRSLRFLMGVGIVAILAPAMAMVLPDRVTGLLPWQDDTPTASGLAPALAAVDRDIQLAETESTIAPTTRQPPSSLITPPTNEADLTAEAPTSTITEESNDSTTTGDNDGKSNSGSQDPTSTTETTSPPKSSTTSTSSRSTSETITGQACPCTVTGTAELKGNVSLQGDLIVEGGSLIARPGVNVNGNGFQIMFMDGGKADFQGSNVFTWSDRGTKQNLERDVVFRNMKRIMWMNGGGKSILKYFTVADSGTPSLGDYPLHWHLNGNSTRGTVVEGVVVINGKHHAYVPHGSHGITFRNTIAKNTVDDAYWWDPGQGINDPRDLTYEHALADGVSPGSSGFHRTTAFNLRGGRSLTVRDSAAINVSGGKNCSGFHWPEKAGNPSIWHFQNNYSQSPDCQGIFVWQNDSEDHVVNGFSGSAIEHGAYSNEYHYKNVNVAGVVAHATGWRMTDSNAGEVTIQRHRKEGEIQFTGVTFDSFTINNGGDSGSVPATYVIETSNLTCSRIQYGTVVPGTEVFIDGERCNK